MGYVSFLNTLRGMNAVYQVQHAKAFNSNILVFGQLVDQFKLQSNQMHQQMAMDRDFNDRLTRQLNSFTKSVADLTEKLDNRTLELSRSAPRRACSSVTPPTADSSSSPQVEIPGRLEYVPGATFRSNFIAVEFGIGGDISTRTIIARAKPLAEVGLLQMSREGLASLLNQDLTTLLARMTTHAGFVKRFNSTPNKPSKIELLRQTFGDITSHE